MSARCRRAPRSGEQDESGACDLGAALQVEQAQPAGDLPVRRDRSGFGRVPQLRMTGLSSAPCPSGTDGCGRFGISSRSASIACSQFGQLSRLPVDAAGELGHARLQRVSLVRAGRRASAHRAALLPALRSARSSLVVASSSRRRSSAAQHAVDRLGGLALARDCRLDALGVVADELQLDHAGSVSAAAAAGGARMTKSGLERGEQPAGARPMGWPRKARYIAAKARQPAWQILLLASGVEDGRLHRLAIPIGRLAAPPGHPPGAAERPALSASSSR